MTRTAFGRPCPTFLEVIQLSEKLDLGIVVASAVKRTLGFYPEADRNDLSQEAWLWLYDHPARVERDADKPKTASWRLTRDLGAHLGDICRREKAQALGYKPEDEYRYGKAMVALALPAAIAGTTEPPTFVREEIAKRTDPSEGGNWMALLADMGMAWEHADLTEQQRELLTDYYCRELTQSEIADAIGSTQQAVGGRIRAATAKVVDYLGGPAAQDLDEDWIDTRLRERPGARRPIGPYADITG